MESAETGADGFGTTSSINLINFAFTLDDYLFRDRDSMYMWFMFEMSLRESETIVCQQRPWMCSGDSAKTRAKTVTETCKNAQKF